jgi:carboxylate-amine ligase
MAATGFRFGLEGEYLLVEQESFRPLWHRDLTFGQLNGLLEGIRYEHLLGGLTLEGLELDPPHRTLMPFYVEGYGLPGADFRDWVDLAVKGVEVRTPVCPSLESCLQVYEELYQVLQARLGEAGLRAVPLSHHPEAWDFQGPQNYARHDWWQWSMRAMTTYGPDLNLSRAGDWKSSFDWDGLQLRANTYAPAIVAFGLASPVGQGRLWQVRGRPGQSLRTYRRSPTAPAVAAHPKEQGRLELKALDMPADRSDFGAYFLLWLWLAFDSSASGTATDLDRIYDLGNVARLGWDAEGLVPRAEEVLDLAERFLPTIDMDPAPLARLRRRLRQRFTPALPLIRRLQANPSIPDLLRHLDRLGAAPEAAADCWREPALAEA